MSETPAETKAPRPRPRWGRIAIVVGVIVVVVLIVLIATIVIPWALKPRANGTACSRYASAYNAYIHDVEVARKSGSPTGLDEDRKTLSTRLTAATAAASGPVKTAMERSRRTLVPYVATPSDPSTAFAFFVTVYPVERACAADGSEIRVTKLK